LLIVIIDAGLTTEERGLLANAYDNGVLKVIVATCSLAAGINLPSRRVILHGAKMGPDLVGPAMLWVGIPKQQNLWLILKVDRCEVERAGRAKTK
jgi:hypothetical protein